MQRSPDIDCVYLNAGVQRPFDLSQPEKVDITTFIDEMNVNYLSNVILAQAFMPLLAKKQSKSCLML
jgi:short-subunit dehydrogenase involved in D-alanine esterification of teichoic acids